MNAHTQTLAHICNYTQMSVHTYAQMHKSAIQIKVTIVGFTSSNEGVWETLNPKPLSVMMFYYMTCLLFYGGQVTDRVGVESRRVRPGQLRSERLELVQVEIMSGRVGSTSARVRVARVKSGQVGLSRVESVGSGHEKRK